MARTTLTPGQLLNKAAIGLSMAFVLSPMAIPFPSYAQTARPVRPQRVETPQPSRSTSPARTSVITTDGGEDPTPVANAGSCNGVDDCNNFIAICVGGGGTYVPGTHNGEGQPTSGSCDVE